jgi:hypothetical protein
MPAASGYNSEAGGIWTLRDAERFKRAGTWPSNAVTPDPLFANVSLLLRMDGANGATTFNDESGNSHAVSKSGTVSISTSQAKFDQSALFGDGRLSVASNAAFGFGTGDFTVEFWLYYTGGNGYVFFWLNNSGSGAYIGYGLNNNTLRPWLWNDGNVLTTTTNITSNTWQHHAVVRQSGVIAIYLNGALLNSGNFSTDIGAARPFIIGDNGVGDQATSGYIDEFRVTKGVARYTSTFTPPDSPFGLA